MKGGNWPWQQRQAPCGPLCQGVKDEVATMGNAEALARLARKQRNQRRGTRER